MIEFIYDMLEFSFSNHGEIPVFREMLADQTACVFDLSTFPESIRFREVDTSPKATGHVRMIGEFVVIVKGSGLNPKFVKMRPCLMAFLDAFPNFAGVPPG